MDRDFEDWISKFKNTIFGYEYFVDFEKIYGNVDEIKVELNIMNSLVGSKNIKEDFTKLLERFPEIIRCIPLLIAVRDKEIKVMDNGEIEVFRLYDEPGSIEKYTKFMERTGLFDLISNRIVNNLVDYALGVEVGLDSNARKNRGGKSMETLVEKYLKDCGVEYYCEMSTSEIERRWGLDLSSISNEGSNIKRFDFVVNINGNIFAIETNFYRSSGSKLNETARSYKMIALQSRSIEKFTFVWVTDGCGWFSAKNNLRDTFDSMEHIYSIDDLSKGIFSKLFVD